VPGFVYVNGNLIIKISFFQNREGNNKRKYNSNESFPGGIKMKNAEQTIGNLADKTGVSIISSVDGFPNSKAMLPTRKRERIKFFCFTTNTSSRRVGQYLANPKACIYFSINVISEGSC
jgi:hypothetical protein